MKLINIHLSGDGKELWINPSAIIRFHRSETENETPVLLLNGEEVYAAETPEEIIALIEGKNTKQED